MTMSCACILHKITTKIPCMFAGNLGLVLSRMSPMLRRLIAWLRSTVIACGICIPHLMYPRHCLPETAVDNCIDNRRNSFKRFTKTNFDVKAEVTPFIFKISMLAYFAQRIPSHFCYLLMSAVSLWPY